MIQEQRTLPPPSLFMPILCIDQKFPASKTKTISFSRITIPNSGMANPYPWSTKLIQPHIPFHSPKIHRNPYPRIPSQNPQRTPQLRAISCPSSLRPTNPLYPPSPRLKFMDTPTTMVLGQRLLVLLHALSGITIRWNYGVCADCV